MWRADFDGVLFMLVGVVIVPILCVCCSRF